MSSLIHCEKDWRLLLKGAASKILVRQKVDNAGIAGIKCGPLNYSPLVPRNILHNDKEFPSLPKFCSLFGPLVMTCRSADIDRYPRILIGRATN